jgi:hypothetical protein
MTPTAGQTRERRCHAGDLYASDDGARPWPEGEVVLASSTEAGGTRYVLALPDAVLDGDALTGFLDRVAPFGCPVPGSLIRAYTMPDNPFPSVLQREHQDAPDGLGGCYDRFLAEARRTWLAALGQAGPGLYPLIAWQAGPERRFVPAEEGAETLRRARASSTGVADTYLGRGLLLLAHPALAEPWPTMMSLGGVTKIRKITGREFPLWVDLPAHQPALLASPVLARAEELLAG